MMLERMLPRPVDESVVDAGGGPRMPDRSPPGSDEVVAPVPVGAGVAEGSRGGRVKLSPPSRPPPPEEDEAEVASGLVVEEAPVPPPKMPGSRPPRRPLSLEVAEVTAGCFAEDTIPLGPKVMADVWVVFSDDLAVVCVDFLVGVGWTTTGGSRPEPEGLSRLKGSPPSLSSAKKSLRPLGVSRRLGETGLAGVVLLTTRLMCLGK
jgi:hypothetical protein